MNYDNILRLEIVQNRTRSITETCMLASVA